MASLSVRQARALVPLIAAGAMLLLPAQAGAAGVTRSIASSGTASFAASPPGSGALQWPEFPRGQSSASAPAAGFQGAINDRSQSQGSQDGENVNGDGNAQGDPGLVRSFNGLTLRDQRLANGGNQFTVEPPDQGLCAGNGYVLESVNDVLRVYDGNGQAQMGVVDLNTFYGYPAQINRTTFEQGPFVTDPSCHYDPQTRRWFQVALTLEVSRATGDFTGRNTLDVAVSKTPSPLGAWSIYRVPVQNDGTEGTPDHHCAPYPQSYVPTHPNACLGDYPHIGADANGFYVTTNEYPLFPPTGFHGAQVYAFSKLQLASGAPTVRVTQFDTAGADRGNPGFTLWPAISPGTQFATAAGGTEYLLSSNAAEEANGTGSSRDLLVWALTNTRSLDSGSPAVQLSHSTLRVGRYALPPTSDQKAGDFPLGQCINDTSLESPAWNGKGCWRALFAPTAEPAHDELLARLDSGDTRMQQVVYADGKLWGALDTALTLGDGNKAGIAWYILRPSARSSDVSARPVRTGYLGMDGNNVTYPAIGVTPDGNGVMAFTLLGPDHHPSAAYTTIDASNGVGDIHVAAAGLGPSDGFTSYKAFVGDPPRTRWGDYGAAAMDGDSIWIASEYTGQSCSLAEYVTSSPASPLFSCGRTRVTLGNWYTRISQLRP
jgi:hypothetical protein